MENKDILITYRAKNNLTQADLALKLGVSRQTVMDIENLKRPSIQTVLAKKIELLQKEMEN